MEKVIDTCIEMCNNVQKTLGPGHKEIIYHNAFCIELRNSDMVWESEKSLPVTYKGIQIGTVRSDIVINNELVLEFKAVTKKLSSTEVRQVQKYMECTDIKYGLLFNFWNTLGISNDIEYLKVNATK